ncbi:MAG TPA: hypothetical protein PLN94_11485 [Thiolinea sp.]|nr:hypothetical protein [Thiolinea sp.]
MHGTKRDLIWIDIEEWASTSLPGGTEMNDAERNKRNEQNLEKIVDMMMEIKGIHAVSLTVVLEERTLHFNQALDDHGARLLTAAIAKNGAAMEEVLEQESPAPGQPTPMPH